MLEARDAALQQLEHLFAGELAARSRHHHGDHDLAPARVGAADDRGFGDVRTFDQQVLDLGRVDVLAAGNDHFLAAAIDIEIAFPVEVSHVAGVEPAVDQHRGGGLRCLPVADHDVVALDQYFPGHAARHVGAELVDDAHAAVGGFPAGRADFTHRFFGLEIDGDGAGFGRAINLHQGHALVVDGVDHMARHDGRAGGNHAQSRKVGAGPTAMRHHHVELCGNQDGQRDAFVLDGVEGGVGVELGVQHHRATGAQGGRRLVVQPADMEQRQRGEDHVVRRQAVHVDAVVGIAFQRTLGQQHAFGLAGGARGVADQQWGVIRDFLRDAGLGGARRHAFGAKLVPAGPAVAAGADGDLDHARREVADAGGLRKESRFDDQHLGRAVAQHLAVLGRRKAPVERHEERAQPGAGKEQGEHLRAVEAEEGDAVAAPDAGRGQRRGEPCHLLRQFRIGNVASRKANCRLVGHQPGIALDPVGQVHGFTEEQRL